MVRAHLISLAALIAYFAILQPALAVETYINLPTIPGENPTPGYPGAIAASPITITPQTLAVTKNSDSTSAPILAAALGGTSLGNISVMLYNSTPAGPPDATLNFFNSTIGSYQSNGATEDVSFSADNPLQLYLEIPGIPGESNTPGHANIMSIDSFSLFGDFSIEKLTDGASDDLFLATAQGTVFPIARLLLYDTLPPAAAPDAIIEFHDVLATSASSIGGGRESYSFNFDTLSQPIPEPTTFTLLAAAIALFATARRR